MTVSFSWRTVSSQTSAPWQSSCLKWPPHYQPQCRVMPVDQLTLYILLVTTRVTWLRQCGNGITCEVSTLINLVHLSFSFSRKCAADVFESMMFCFTCSDCAQWGGWRAACSWVLQSVWRSTRSFSGKTAAVTGHMPFPFFVVALPELRILKVSVHCVLTMAVACRINGFIWVLWLTRNTLCGTWYLPHSQVHNDRTVIIMAGCIVHACNAHISTSALKSDVTLVFLNPDFL